MLYSVIINQLADAGIDVALPGAKQEICLAPYAVVQRSGTYHYAQSERLGYSLISVHCYAPLQSYDMLDDLIERVKSALKSLEPDLRPVGNESPHIINDKFRAHEASIDYYFQRRTVLSQR